MSYSNAVDIQGVWSSKPLYRQEIETMLHMTSPLQGTRVFSHADARVVEEWTRGAMDVSEEFKDLVEQFINVQSQRTDRMSQSIGRRDAISSLRILL